MGYQEKVKDTGAKCICVHEKEAAGVAHGQPCLSHHLHLLRKLACASLCSATLKPSAAARSWASKTEECACACLKRVRRAINLYVIAAAVGTDSVVK